MTQTFGIGKCRTRDGRIAEVTRITSDGSMIGLLDGLVATWTRYGWAFNGRDALLPNGLDLIAPIDEQPGVPPEIRQENLQILKNELHVPSQLLATDGWIDITHSLPGHHQVVIVQDEEGNVAVARMGVCFGFDVVTPEEGQQKWFVFGAVQRWRVV